MVRGDGVRRNVATVDPDERDALIAAIKELHHRYFPGSRNETPVGGVSWWFKQDEIHQATHVHGGPEFVPWHRELCNRFETLIRTIDPRLSLHYWDWSTDPAPLFTNTFMGAKSGAAGDPWLSAGFYDPGADPYRGDSAFDAAHSNPFDPPRHLTRSVQAGAPNLPFSDNDVISAPDYQTMRARLESSHNTVHGYIGGTIGDPHTSFRDPFVYLLHSNNDRLFAMWQAADPVHRLDATTVYGTEPSDPTWYTRQLRPWNGVGVQTRPWAPPENQQEVKDYRHPSIVAAPCYDTMGPVHLIEVVNPTATINFNDVPEAETAIRAAVFRVWGCGDATLHIKAGSGPNAPYSVFIPPGTVTAHQGPHPFAEARIWFAFTGGDPAVAVPDGQAVVHCDETGDDFPFTLKANSIEHPKVAVVLALDQSGSMDDLAGTTGARRIDVLKDAATRFVEIIQAGNGVGLIRFDTDAYSPTDATFPGLAVTEIGPGGTLDPNRGLAIAAVGAHATNPNGWTSIGDGVVQARATANAAPAGVYDEKALLVFTDGLENQPLTIAAAASSIDARTFAIGLGTETQVSTAALTALANGTGGYLLLTGHLTPSTDDYFRLSKFFLQILAGVTNTNVVRDPNGFVAPKTKVRVPFDLAETDIDVTVVTMMDLPALIVTLETPDGTVLDPAAVNGFGGLYADGTRVNYYRLNLPAPVGPGAHAGRWHAVLTVDGTRFKRALAKLKDDPVAQRRAAAHGVRYSTSILSFSNLRMDARLDQSGNEPGAELRFQAVLTEYGQPVEQRATTRVHVIRPNGTQVALSMSETDPGVFEASMPATAPGTYQAIVRAAGATFRGMSFTRDQILTGAVFRGGDGPFPFGGADPDGTHQALCQLLHCVLRDGGLDAALKRWEIDPDRVERCLERFCHATQQTGTPN